MSEIIREQGIDLDRLRTLLEGDGMACQPSERGDLLVEAGHGVKTMVRLDAEQRLVILLALFRLRPDAPADQKLAWVNTLNDRLMLVRFQVASPEAMWCDHHVSYVGGLLAPQFVATVRRFAEVCRGAVASYDPDGLVGEA